MTPVEKLAKHVETNVAKVVGIQSDVGHGITEVDIAHGSTSAHDAASHLPRHAHHHSQHHNPHYNHVHGAHHAHHRRTKSTQHSGDSGHTKASRRPQFAPAAPKRTHVEEEGDEDEDFDVHGFDHPSTYAEQPWIWVPRDQLGLSAVFVREFRALGVHASDEGAVMDERGNVEVNRSPPDEEWHGGHDA